MLGGCDPISEGARVPVEVGPERIWDGFVEGAVETVGTML